MFVIDSYTAEKVNNATELFGLCKRVLTDIGVRCVNQILDELNVLRLNEVCWQE